MHKAIVVELTSKRLEVSRVKELWKKSGKGVG
jgi:hypothetical protein